MGSASTQGNEQAFSSLNSEYSAMKCIININLIFRVCVCADLYEPPKQYDAAVDIES